MTGMRQKNLATYGYSKLKQDDASDVESINGDTSSKTGVNVFEVVSDDDEIEEQQIISMKTLKRSLHDGGSNVEIYEIDISGAHGNESLQKIALKYSCSVWELKRVNGLQNMQDFHALNRIRIPAMVNSFRAELLQRDGRRMMAEPGDDGSFVSPLSSSDPQTRLHTELALPPPPDSELGRARDEFFRTVSIRQTIANDSEAGDQFLRHMDTDLARIRETVTSMKDSLDEVTHTLTVPRIRPLPPRHVSLKDRFRLSGVDCGVSWRTVLCVSLLVAVGVPVLGLAYYLLRPRGES